MFSLWGSKAKASKPHFAGEDKLGQDHLRQEGECHLLVSGIPDTADSCAYEPLQKLLAVSRLGSTAMNSASSFEQYTADSCILTRL